MFSYLLLFLLMSESLRDYDDLVKKMTNEVIDQIEQQIENQMISIGAKDQNVETILQKQEEKRKMRKAKGKKAVQPSLEQLNEIKRSKLLELQEIQRQESLLKKSAVLGKSHVSKSCNKLWRSEFTEEEMNQIKAILHRRKEFENQVKKKESRLESWLLEKSKEEEELKRQFLAEQSQHRKKEITRQREELEKKKKERTQLLQEEIKKMKEIKSKKLLHEQMTQAWKKYDETTQKEKQRMWAEHKQKIRVNSKQIHEHQTKYLQLRKQNQKKRERALQQSRSLRAHLPYIHAQIFYRVQKQEEQHEKIEQMKTHEKQDNIVKKKLYSKQVNELFLPKVKITQKVQNQLKKSASTTKMGLTGEESYKLGNDYMKTAHEKVTVDLIEKMKQSLKKQQQPKGLSSTYKNYLKDLRSQNTKQNGPIIQTVQSTLKNTKLSSSDKIHKVKLILQKDKGGKKKDSQIIDSIKTKMKVLNELMNENI